MSGHPRALLPLLLGALLLSLAPTCDPDPEPPRPPATLSFESSISPNPPAYAARIDVFLETDDALQAVDVQIELTSPGTPQLWVFPSIDFGGNGTFFGGQPFITTTGTEVRVIDVRHGPGAPGRVQILTVWVVEANGESISITATAESSAPDGALFETSSTQVDFPQL